MAGAEDRTVAPGRHRHKTVYFFGAGASAAETSFAPTNQDLLTGGLLHRRHRYHTLKRFLRAWGFKDQFFLPTIEELLSILDTCLSRGEPMGRFWTISELTRAREELISCIYEYIGETIAGERGSDSGLYEALLQRAAGPDVTLMSLNYDLLLDNALLKLGHTPDYGLEFVDEGEPPTASRVKLFKLHGSLNWACCPSCFSNMRLTNRKVPAAASCPLCGGTLNALIVPPTPMKVPPSPFVSSLWKKAEWELAQAREIVFIGYSLSEADANIRYLLFRSFFGYKPQVTVVLKRHPSGRDPLIAGRYQRLFPGGVEFHWGGFEAFATGEAGEPEREHEPGSAAE